MITTSALAAAPVRGRLITLWILSSFAALLFIGVGGAKLAGAAVMVELFAKVGLGQWARQFPSRPTRAVHPHRDHRVSAKVMNANQQRNTT